MSRRAAVCTAVAVMTLTAFLTSCVDSPNGPEEPSAARGSLQAKVSPRPLPITLDEEFMQMAEQVPGFGGLYDDPESDETFVYLRDPMRDGDARVVVDNYLVRTAAAGRRLRILAGSYDFRDLVRWRQAVERTLPAVLTLTDADEVTNRVVIGVRDATGVQTVRASLPRLGVPDAAVTIEVRAPVVLENLMALTRPVMGGLQIRAVPAAGWECSLGFVALREFPLIGVDISGPRYAITNSHCTSSMGFVSGDVIGQPTEANRLGVEISDPPFVGSTTDPMCPVAWNGCRRSDAAMFELDDNSTAVSSFNGFALSSSVSPPTVPQLLGSATYTGRQQGFRSGMRVDKSGRSTGQTTGTVRSTCVNVPMPGYWMVCQFTASYNSSGGDSGSPVWFTDSNGQRWVMGIHWGRQNNSPFDRFFSRWLDVWSELGNDVLARTGVQWAPSVSTGPSNFNTF